MLCDQCGQDAHVFALQASLKVKACKEHSVQLMEKHSTIFSIAAYHFIEQAENYPEYERRRNLATMHQGSFAALKERCDSNRDEATLDCEQPRKRCYLCWTGASRNCG